MMDCHRIEKGLALPSPKSNFGQDVLQRLYRNVQDYENEYGAGLPSIAARQAVAEYVEFHRSIGCETCEEAVTLQESSSEPIAGTKKVSKPSELDFEELARSRHSVRQFTGDPVDLGLIKQAVAIAQTAPSVCNRQSGRVYVALDRETRNRVLSFQNGNTGFGDLAGAVLIVTSDMRIFQDIGERNQCWVDGGLFTMTLCFALHSFGLGTCMLNWCQSAEMDKKMRSAAGIPDHDAVITMMAVGYTESEYSVAVSPRRSVDSILQVVE